MDYRLQSAYITTIDFGMGVAWQPDGYTEFFDNSPHTLDAPDAGTQCMLSSLDGNPK
jgi:hypothetical protein